jgi:hypothetical protein
MTSNEPFQHKRSLYNTCDPHYLRQMREAAGMDLVVLARIACLSVAQVQALERDGDENFFYSDAIKRQAYKRVLMVLGAEPPTVEMPEALHDVDKVAEAHRSTLAQIVAMSEQPAMSRSNFEWVRAGLSSLQAHKQLLSALLLLTVAIVWFVLRSPQISVQAVPAPQTFLPPTAPAPAPAPPASVTDVPVVSSVGACAYSNEPMSELTSFVARKEGRYVYLVSTTDTEVCVVDGNKEATRLQFKAGEDRSVHGIPPWQVSGSNLQKIQIYFQGGRVSLPDNASRVKLVEVPVAR